MDLVLMLHSMVRWLVLLAAVAAIVKFAVGWRRGGAFSGLDRGLSLGFSGLLDLQALLGLIVLIGGGLAGAGFPRYRLEHAVTMHMLGPLTPRYGLIGDNSVFSGTMPSFFWTSSTISR